MKEIFEPESMLKDYGVVLDFSRAKHLQVYPLKRAARITGAKPLGIVRAFDQQDAERKAQKFQPKEEFTPRNPWPPRAA